MGQHQLRNRAEDRARCGSRIPAWRFEFEGLTAPQRVDAWNDACSGFYDVTMDLDEVARTRAAFSWHRLDDLMFSSGTSFPHVARRTGDHVRQQKKFVRLLFSKRAGSRIVADEHYCELDAGAIHLIDYSRPYVHIRSDCIDLTGVYVPHEAIGYDPSRHPAHIRIGAETPTGQVLSGAFAALNGQLDRLEMRDAPSLARGLSDLIRALVLRDTANERGLAVVRSARREAMRGYLEQNLRDPSLGIIHLCRKFGASRATIYRDFEALGGVAQYILARRLERALSDLVECEVSRGSVTAIAVSWGFESLHHFSRRFRERFGIAPSEIAGLGAGTLGDRSSATAEPGLEAPNADRSAGLAAWFDLHA